MPQPVEVTEAAERAIALFVNAQQRLIAEQAAILALPADQRARFFSRRRRINQVLAAIDAEMDATRRGFATWAANELPAIYELGGTTAGNLAPVIGDFTWNQIHRGAVQQIATDMYTDVLSATEFVSTDAKRWMRDMSRRSVAGAVIEGRTPTQAARDLVRHGAKRLSDMGDPLPITSVRYKDGSLRTFDDYADMLIRTKASEAFTTGNLNFATQAGVNTFEVFDGSDCTWPTGHGKGNANGQIVTAKEAFENPNAHPRCQRAFGPRPDLDDVPTGPFQLSTTAEQRANQAAFERSNNRRPTRTPRTPRTTGRTPRTPRTPTRTSSPVLSAAEAQAAERAAQGFGLTDALFENTRLNLRSKAKHEKVIRETADRSFDLIKATNPEAVTTFLRAGQSVKILLTKGKSFSGKTRGYTAGHWRPATNELFLETNRFDRDLWRRRVDEYNEAVGQYQAGIITRADLPKIPKSANRAATADEISGTMIHELVHTVDYDTGLVLRQQIDTDGTFAKVKAAYRDSSVDDSAMYWYASTKPSEALPELVRMYFEGSPRHNVDGKTWRKRYPEFASWVETNVFTAYRKADAS